MLHPTPLRSMRRALFLFLAFLLFPVTVLRAEENIAPTALERQLAGSSTSLRSFYEARRFEPAWKLADASSAKIVNDFVSYIRSVLYENGLSEKGYDFKKLLELLQKGGEDNYANADILVTQMVLRLAASLAGQDMVPQSKMHTWPLRTEKTDLAGGLNAAVNDHNVSEYLANLLPKTPKYQVLKAALAGTRTRLNKEPFIKIPGGKSIKPGDADSRLPALAQRLQQGGYYSPAEGAPLPSTYDEALVEAVKQFQDTHGLNADGAIGAETIRALNVTVAERIDQIRVNMARMRHSPPDAWEDIVVNIPSAQLNYYRDGELVYAAPVVVGRKDRPTPLVRSEIYEMIINPPWYVPRSIAEKDILPKLQKNPDYLEKMGISVRDGGDEEGDIAGRLRQKPGPGNSLGRLKFNFQNRHAVYLHGTPHLELFGRDDRNQSSGCVRLQKPDELALILMKDQPDWNAETLQAKIDSLKTIYVNPPERTPVKLLYWTVLVDNNNRLHFFNDVYGLDREWLAYL